jgi:subtilisin family serine protease
MGLSYADERTRTSTGASPHGPEPCASTSSATSAGNGIVARRVPCPDLGRGLVVVLLTAAVFWPGTAAAQAGTVDVVVTLEAPSLSRAVEQSRALSVAAKRRRLSLSSPTSVSHLAELRRQHDAVAARILRELPGAAVRWRYRIVLNGLAVTLPRAQVARLASLPGVAEVVHGTRYAGASTATAVGPPAAWSRSVAATGEGVKIAILDDGVDQRHPFFSPAGFAMPESFPKGNAAYTTAKVIAARAFPPRSPRSPRWRHAATPFDPEQSDHGTHVAGIAAGNAGVLAADRRTTLSGVAPRAHIGNYKVLTIPTDSGVGLDGNSPEIVAGIEAAVADGMDVINLSLGEPEIEPTRDLVTRAVDAASDAGVVVTIAAGNDGGSFGAGSVSSPGSAAKAITVAATQGRSDVAGFSSIGPAPLSLRLKPDVAAPGVDVLSSVPARAGTWAAFSGTSMAAPHVAGAVALLLERHPEWTPPQVKSALVQTAAPLPFSPTRAGAGAVEVARADAPLLFAAPTSVSFGLVRRGARVGVLVDLADAGGAGEWRVAVDAAGDPRVRVEGPETVTVPGRLELVAAVGANADAEAHPGFVTLTRGETVRRLPYWLRVTARRLARQRKTPLRKPGVYRGSTRGRPALVPQYRYPEAGSRLAGPEQVFRVTLARPVANFGVVVLSRGRGVAVQPRIVGAGDENRLVGYTSLPFNLNPYLETFMEPRLAAGAVLPRPGKYDVVFDSPTRAGAGAYRFRFWVNDVTPPKLRVLRRAVPRGAPLRVRATDAGSGVDPRSTVLLVDGVRRPTTFRNGLLRVSTAGLRPGAHRLFLQVSDYQETRNMENVARILPNTRRLTVTFRVT